MANYGVSTTANSNSSESTQYKSNKKQAISNQSYLFILKPECLKMYVDFQTTFTAETCLKEGQRLEKQLNMVQLCISRVETEVFLEGMRNI
jgi:hypothetical protein